MRYSSGYWYGWSRRDSGKRTAQPTIITSLPNKKVMSTQRGNSPILMHAMGTFDHAQCQFGALHVGCVPLLLHKYIHQGIPKTVGIGVGVPMGGHSDGNLPPTDYQYTTFLPPQSRYQYQSRQPNWQHTKKFNPKSLDCTHQPPLTYPPTSSLTHPPPYVITHTPEDCSN